jgi:hypothetical protein
MKPVDVQELSISVQTVRPGILILLVDAVGVVQLFVQHLLLVVLPALAMLRMLAVFVVDQD